MTLQMGWKVIFFITGKLKLYKRNHDYLNLEKGYTRYGKLVSSAYLSMYLFINMLTYQSEQLALFKLNMFSIPQKYLERMR